VGAITGNALGLGGSPLFGLNLSEMDNQAQVGNAMKEIAASYARYLERNTAARSR
jgi:hypothetical protein